MLIATVDASILIVPGLSLAVVIVAAIVTLSDREE